MLHPINLAIGELLIAFILQDTLLPALKFPLPELWKVKGIVTALAYIALATYSHFLWVSWMTGRVLFEARAWRRWVGCVVG